MRRTRRSGGKPPKKSSAERLHSAKKAIQRRRGTRVAQNAARIAAARMEAAEEAARQQAIANADAVAQRAAAEAQRAASYAAQLRQLPNVSFRMQVRPVPSFLESHPLHLQQQGMENQERFLLRLVNE